MRPHLAIARWTEQHEVATNAVVVSVLMFFTVLGSVSGGWGQFIGAALVGVPVNLRIGRPVTAALLVALATVISTVALGVWPVATGFWAVPMVIHRVAARSQRSHRLGVLGLALVVALVVSLVSPLWSEPMIAPGSIAFGGTDWWMAVLVITPFVWLVVITSYLLGDVKRVRWEREQAEAQRAQALADRAEALAAWAHRLEIERDQEVRLAAQDERTRIAREMHDVVAHSLSVVITQADGARYASAADPTAAVETLERISTTARGSLTEMRRLLGVLRTDDAQQVTPVPGTTDVPDLVQGVRQSGLPVDLTLPEDPEALSRLPAGASLALYRLVQEGLTNVLKHCPKATGASVVLRSGHGWAEAQVVNDGLLAAQASQAAQDSRSANRHGPSDDATHRPIPSSGQGLRGLAERLGVYGGQLEATPSRDNADQWVIRGWVTTDDQRQDLP